MKKNVITVSLIILIFSVFSSVPAQEKKISEQEFVALRKNASEKIKDKSYRVKMTGESSTIVTDPAPSWFTTSIIEHTSDGYHNVYETKSADKVTRNEEIKVGNRKYIRLNNEAWKEVSTTSPQGVSDSGSGAVTLIKSDKTVEWKYKGKKSLNGQNTDLYEVKTTTKFKLRDKDITSIFTERFWLSQDGLVLKTESESERNKKVFSHAVYEYEYDPSIKIESPIK